MLASALECGQNLPVPRMRNAATLANLSGVRDRNMGIPLPRRGEFEEVILVEVLIEEMFGSD